jgi:hypothetical protein
MKENQLIPLFKIVESDYKIAELHLEYEYFIADFNEFKQFCLMQSKYYPRGVIKKQFNENVVNYCSSVTLTNLMKKLGNGYIKEHTSDDGTTYYSLGESGE